MVDNEAMVGSLWSLVAVRKALTEIILRLSDPNVHVEKA